MLDLMTLHTRQRKQYVCWSDQSNHRVGTQGESVTEIRELSFVAEFRYQGDVLIVQAVEMIRILKNNSGGKIQLALYARQKVHICTYRGKNPIVQVILLPNLWM